MTITSSTSHSVSVLLVDDDPIQLKLSRTHLMNAGFDVRVASNAAETMKALDAFLPNVIVSDVLMKDLDGFALCQMLRSHSRLAGVPVLLISAHFVDQEDAKLALAVGASGLIERTPDFSSELAAIHKSLSVPVPMGGTESVPGLYLTRIASQLTRLLAQSRVSETGYEALWANASDAMALLTPAGVILRTNRKLENLLQYSSEQMVGKHIRDFAAPDHDPQNVEQFQRVIHEGTLSAPAYCIRRADGQCIYVAFSSANIEVNGQSSVLSIGRDITESVENARKLQESEKQYRALLENIPDVVWSASIEGKLNFMTPNLQKLTGYTREEVLASPECPLMDRVDPEDRPHVVLAFEQLLREHKPVEVEFRFEHKSGEPRWFRTRASLVSADGERHIEGVTSDVTARKELEEQLRHSQKMEAVARLTGGVAHDFNNILAAILANSQFLIDDLAEQDPRRSDAVEIKRSAERAAALTAQLLTFSRRQVVEPSIVNLNKVVAGIEKMLRRLIGEDVELVICPEANLGCVRADVGQMDQIIMNLAVNARDAMPRGGKLTIELSNAEWDEDGLVTDGEIKAGSYVLLSVTDTGCGMDAATRRRIFEPFFTTKEQGQGAGARNWTGIVHHLRNREAEWRSHRGQQRTGVRQHVQDLSSSSCRCRECDSQTASNGCRHLGNRNRSLSGR